MSADHAAPGFRDEPSPRERALLVGGRAALASLFVLGGIVKIAGPELYLAMMDEAGLAPARPLLTLVIVLELGGGLWIASGLRGHALAALALAVHTLLVNLFLHPFWSFDGAARIAEISFFFKNVSIVGGLVFIAGVERWRARPARRPAGTGERAAIAGECIGRRDA